MTFEIATRSKVHGPMKAQEIGDWIATLDLREDDDGWIVRQVGSHLRPPPVTASLRQS